MTRQSLVPRISTVVALILVVFAGSVRAQQQPHPIDPELVEAQKAAGKLVVERLRQTSAEDGRLLRRCAPSAVLLVEGRHDHTERVLRCLGIPFSTCSAPALARRSLRGVRLLIVDCPGLIGASYAKVRRFVASGGTLLTTDWAVLHTIQTAFGISPCRDANCRDHRHVRPGPPPVRYTGRPTRDDVVRISHIARHPLTRGVFPPGRSACWWLENQSYPVEIVDRARVETLFSSQEMSSRYGTPTIALTFGHGRGRVVHVVSHTYLQRNELRERWERRSFADEASSLGFRTDGEVYRKLSRDGVLRRIPAGHLNAATSIQQFVLNVVLAALRPAPVPHPPQPPRPPVPPRPPIRPLPPAPPRVDPAVSAQSLHDTVLRSAPGGAPVLRVAAGLRLVIRERRGDWVRVETPAGQSGWVARRDVGGR